MQGGRSLPALGSVWQCSLSFRSSDLKRWERGDSNREHAGQWSPPLEGHDDGASRNGCARMLSPMALGRNTRVAIPSGQILAARPRPGRLALRPELTASRHRPRPRRLRPPAPQTRTPRQTRRASAHRPLGADPYSQPTDLVKQIQAPGWLVSVRHPTRYQGSIRAGIRALDALDLVAAAHAPPLPKRLPTRHPPRPQQARGSTLVVGPGRPWKTPSILRVVPGEAERLPDLATRPGCWNRRRPGWVSDTGRPVRLTIGLRDSPVAAPGRTDPAPLCRLAGGSSGKWRLSLARPASRVLVRPRACVRLKQRRAARR